MPTMSDVREILSRFKKTKIDIQTQRKRIKHEIAKEEKVLSDLSDLNITIEDHVDFHGKFIREQEQLLRLNIQNYLKGSKTYREESAGKSVRTLDGYLRRFGQRSAGRELWIPYVMAVRGSWKRLREIVEEELGKLPRKTWGPWQSQMRAKKSDASRRKIKECQKALAELGDD